MLDVVEYIGRLHTKHLSIVFQSTLETGIMLRKKAIAHALLVLVVAYETPLLIYYRSLNREAAFLVPAPSPNGFPMVVLQEGSR